MAVKASQQGRKLSIDFFHGITMFLLIGEFSGLFDVLIEPPFEGTIAAVIARQFHHHPWNGLRFWGLIQPFFMFIVGVSLPLSVKRRVEKGETRKKIKIHVVKQSIMLLFLGWSLYCIDKGGITWQFQNVLAQLSVTYLIAYLIMNQSFFFPGSFFTCGAVGC